MFPKSNWGGWDLREELGKIGEALYLQAKIGTRELELKSDTEIAKKVPLQLKKRGPKANMDFHRAVADLVRPYDGKWREKSNLISLSKQLDRNRKETPPLFAWRSRRPPAATWSQAVGNYPSVVIHAIVHSLNMTARELATEKLS